MITSVVSFAIKKQTLVLVLLTGIFFATSLPGLFVDVLNTDGVNWHTRSRNFMESLLSGDFESTYQAYHPGFTLMWLSGPPLYVLGEYMESGGFSLYGKDTYLYYDYLAKLCVVLASSVLFLYSLIVLKLHHSLKLALVFGLLVILEPYMLGQRRLYHLDYLTGYLLVCSFLSVYHFTQSKKLFTQVRKRLFLVLGAIFFTLAFLTKSLGIIFLPIPILTLILASASPRSRVLAVALFTLVVGFSTYLVVPALWRSPLHSARSLYTKISAGAIEIGYMGKKDIGFAGGKENVILDEVSQNGSVDYYIKALANNLSPGTLLALAASLVYTAYLVSAKRGDKPVILSGITVLVFLGVMSISNKKGLRYGAVFYPFLFYIMARLLTAIKSNITLGMLFVHFLLLIPQYVQIYPYFYAYGNPLMGGTRARVQVFTPGALGVGTYAVHQAILKQLKPDKQATVSGNKSLKVMSSEFEVSSSESCTSDFIVKYGLNLGRDAPCGASFKLTSTVTVGNYPYWYIYKNDGY